MPSTTPWSIDDLQTLWRLATELHQGQTYGSAKQGQRLAYISHIGSVTFEVIQALQQDPTLEASLCLSCAVLHDVIEDTPCSHATLVEKFGPAVADGVLALSKDPNIGDRSEQMRDSLARIQQQPREIGVVKLADRISNMQIPPHYWTPEKKQFYRAEAQDILDALGSCSPYLAERLATKIARYHEFIEP